MTAYSKLAAEALDTQLAPALEAMGFVRARGRRQAWTDAPLQIRAVFDSKANDPYSGGAFTLEFEISNDGHFERKLAGRVRIDQLLDDAQRRAFLDVRNDVARRLEPPPAAHLAQIDPSIHREYLKPFQEVEELESGHRFWMRFATAQDLDDWCRLIAAELPRLVERARTLPPHELILGKPLEW